MSHFVVMVKLAADFLEKHGSVEDAIEMVLAPYQENNGDTPEEYLKFNETETGYRSQYEKDKVMVIVLKDGQEESLYSSKLYKKAEKEIHAAKPTSSWPTTEDIIKHIRDAGHKLVERPMSEVFLTFDQYMKEYVGEEKDEETGKYGYWENPNAKWDWWAIGGRWQGMLKTKAGDVDCAKIKDINWDHYKQEAKEKINARYEKMKEYWDITIKHNYDREKIDAELKSLGRDPFHSYDLSTMISRFGLTDTNGKLVPLIPKDEFIKKYLSYDEFGTYAVLEKNGDWIAKGDMGWFGCSSESPDEARKWDDSFFDNFIAKEDPETTLVMVDCHI